MAEGKTAKRRVQGCLTVSARDVTDLKEVIKEKGKEELEGLKEPEKTQLFPVDLSRQAR